jgi:hypothetical protein
METKLQHFISEKNDNSLKMYYFNPNTYGDEYFTIASNKEEALKNILNFIQNKIDKSSFEVAKNSYINDYNTWSSVNPNDPSTFPDLYTLDVYENGGVIQSEIC